MHGYLLIIINILLLLQAHSLCTSPSHEVLLIKQWTDFSDEESWEIYEVRDLSLDLLHSGSYNASEVVNHQTNYTVCIKLNQVYKFIMKDAYGDGWGTAATPAPLLFYLHDMLFFQIDFPYRSETRYQQIVYNQFDSLISFSSEWKYSDANTLPSTWYTRSYNDHLWGSSTYASFPPITKTRYYRFTVNCSVEKNSLILLIHLRIHSEYVLYLNEKEIHHSSSHIATLEREPHFHYVSCLDDFPAYVFSSLRYQNPSLGFEVDFYGGSIHDLFSLFSDPPLVWIQTPIEATPHCLPESSIPYEQCSSIYDRSYTTKYSTTSSTPTITITFTRESRTWVNFYSFTTTTDKNQAPFSWTVYGYDDSQERWISLNRQESVQFSTQPETRYFSLLQNHQLFNTYRFSISSTAANNGFQLAEIQLYSIQNVNTSTPYYLKSVYYFHVNTTISILPIGLHDSCSFSSLDLPSNLTLSSTTGEISGALDTIQQYLFTVVITDSSQQILDQLTFDLHIVDCSSPSYSQLVISKQNEDLYSLERIQLYDAEEGLLFDSIYSPVLLEQQWSICLPSSIYTLTLSAETEAGWGASSFLSISLIRERTYQLLQYSLSQQSKTLQMNTQYIIDSHITSWYYTAYSSTIPDSWYSSAYQPDDQWSIFDYSSLNIIRHNVYLFKISVPLSNLNAYRSWEFSINIISGVIIYINSYEIYRLNMNYQALTPTSVPLHVDEAYVWRTIVGNLVTLSNSESLSISIALIYPSSFLYTAPLLLDATFRFLTETNEISLIHIHNANIICYDHDEESEAHNCSSILHFQSPSSYVSAPIGLSSNKTIDIRFNHQNSYAINYYCLTNGRLEPQSDPMNWNIYGIDGTNNTVLVGFVTNSYWTTRLQKKCFFLQNITPYVGLRFVFFYSPYYSSLYSSHPISISHMEFYVDFLSHYPMAPLTVLPSNFEVLSGLDFPPMTFSHSHFYSLSISPSLPGELFFDSSTGIIFGKSSGLLESTTYTLQGSSFVGSMLITTLTIRIVYCTSPSILLSIRFDIKAESTTYSWYLMNQDQNDLIVYKNEHNVPSNTVVLYSFCLAPSVYSLILEDDDGLGWNQSEYSVFFSDQTILAEGVISSTTPKRIPLDISSFIMYPKTQQWYYWSLASSPPMNWNVLESPYSPWIPSYPSSLPFLSFTTQYYVTSFVISSIEDKYSAIEITVNNYAGMVLYLNGIEIGRIHLPNGSVSYSTLATEEYEDYRPFTVTIPSQYSYVHIGTNYLAVEIHSLSAIPAINRFDSKMIYIPNHSYRVLDGNCTSSSLSGYNTKVYHVFDNDITTEYITSTVCSNTTIEWMYNNQRFEYINQYRIINGKDCNTRTPSSWMLEGWVPSDNEWVLLHQVAHERFTQYNQRKTYSFVTNRSFNRIRYTVTECRNPSIQDSVTCNTDVRLFQLSEIQFLVSNLQSICSSVDGFPSALNGEYSYKLCSQGYTGTMKRLCQNSQFQEILDECVLLEPSLLQYDTNYTLYNNYEYQISPLVQGAELSFLIHPSLPVSLSFNSSTGEISGVPTLSIPRTRYIVQCWNAKGSLTTELYVTVVDAYCEEDGVWPVTIAGETQVSLCSDPINYEGQITRRCLNTTPPRWDSVLHNCIVKYPQLIYTPNSIYGFKGLPILTLVPVIYGVGILRIYPVSQFPQGIYLDPQTGAVYGTPATEDRRALIIAIENTRGTTQVQVTIFISVLVCLQDNEWGTTEHSTTVYMNCTNDQLGVQSRSCEATSHYSVSWSTADYSHCFTYESLYQYSDNNLLYHFDVFLYGIDLSDYCNPICMETIRSTLEVFLQLGVAVDSQLYSISSQQRNASVAVHYCFHISKTSRLLVKEQLIELFRNKSVLLEKLADYQSLPIGKIYDIELDDDSIFYNLNRYSNTVILLLVVGSFIVNFVICMLIVLYYCAYYHKYKMKVKNVYQPKGEFSGLNH